MDANFSKKVKDILNYSKEEALRLGYKYISPEHLFLGILRDGNSVALDIISSYGVDLRELKRLIESRIDTEQSISKTSIEDIPFVKKAERVLTLVQLEAKDFKSHKVNTVHLLLAILHDKKNVVSQTLQEFNIDYDKLKSHELAGHIAPKAESNRLDDDDDDETTEMPKSAATKSDTPVLDNFGIDLTKAAEDNKLDPVIGRDSEIERLVQILSRRKKNNPVLIGEPGVGKSAIVEGLAIRIVKKKVSRVLFDRRIVTLDLASIVAGTKYRGQFEERIKSILNELTKDSKVILFIDEIHTIVGAGGASGSLDAANMLKPALARGEIQCIGATTLDEYRQYIEKDGALERRFQKIMVDPTSEGETLEILHNIKDKYESHHSVIYTEEALSACVKLTTRYITDRHLPDKAIDALDEAGSNVHISNIVVPPKIEEIESQIDAIRKEKIKSVRNQKFEEAANFRDKEQKLLKLLEQENERWSNDISQYRETVTETHVEQVVSMMTGIPLTRIAQAEGAKLMNMGETLQQQLIGQDEAIQKIVKSIQRNRAGLKDPNKPIGTFIFLGPTGVGKTQLAKILALNLFDSADALIRIDMSEYMEKFSVSRLVGAPPGYVGYEEGGQLTEKVRRKPYSVVLLDEIEKAHPDVFHLLLQVLDDGLLTDSLGRKIDFKNTIVIMTSNIGSREIKDFGRTLGFSNQAVQDQDDHNKTLIQKALKKAFSPEFLNRIDDVIVFNGLTREHIHKIIDIELKGFNKRVENLGYKIDISEEAKDFIAEKGFDVKFGARPLKRAIQKYLEDNIAEVIISSAIKKGDKILVNLNDAKEDIKISIDHDIVLETSEVLQDNNLN